MPSTKMIKIPSRGIVTTSRGRVVTPVYNPYRESTEMIYKMLCNDKPTPKIIEVLPNGREIPLTLQNYDKDNELVHPVIKPASVVPSMTRVEQTEDIKQPEKESMTFINPATQPSYNNGKKKNKHKNQQTYQPSVKPTEQTVDITPTETISEPVENDCYPVE